MTETHFTKSLTTIARNEWIDYDNDTNIVGTIENGSKNSSPRYNTYCKVVVDNAALNLLLHECNVEILKIKTTYAEDIIKLKNGDLLVDKTSTTKPELEDLNNKNSLIIEEMTSQLTEGMKQIEEIKTQIYKEISDQKDVDTLTNTIKQKLNDEIKRIETIKTEVDKTYQNHNLELVKNLAKKNQHIEIKMKEIEQTKKAAFGALIVEHKQIFAYLWHGTFRVRVIAPPKFGKSSKQDSLGYIKCRIIRTNFKDRRITVIKVDETNNIDIANSEVDIEFYNICLEPSASKKHSASKTDSLPKDDPVPKTGFFTKLKNSIGKK